MASVITYRALRSACTMFRSPVIRYESRPGRSSGEPPAWSPAILSSSVIMHMTGARRGLPGGRRSDRILRAGVGRQQRRENLRIPRVENQVHLARVGNALERLNPLELRRQFRVFLKHFVILGGDGFAVADNRLGIRL